MKLVAFNIEYTNRETYISCIGPEALEGYANHGFLNLYDGKSAPKSIDIEVNLTQDYILNNTLEAEKVIKAKLEEELGLTVKSFSYRIIC